MRIDQQPSVEGVCSNCGYKGQVYELGMLVYQKKKRPHLCFKCDEEWDKYYIKNRGSFIHIDWKDFFEGWLASNPTSPEVVQFT